MRLPSAVALLLLWTVTPTVVAAPAEEGGADVQALQEAGLSADDAALLRYFREATPDRADHTTIPNLITQLGDDDFTVREQASARLVKVGAAAAPLLRRAARSDDVEVVRRAEKILAQLGKERNLLVPCAAARLLARRQPAGAAETLLGFLPFAGNEAVAEEVRTTLAAVALVNGEPDRALTAALADKWPAKRAAAAEALIRAGSAAQRPDLRRLLGDQDLRVRLPVAQALAAAGDREAVPVLIDLLAELPSDQVGPVEDLLQHLAGDQSPEAPRSGEQQARQAYREQWAGWWQKNGAKADLSRLAPGKTLGCLLVLNVGFKGPTRVMELDKSGKQLWAFDGPENIGDGEVVGPDRVLLAETGLDRVTERTLKGEVVWKVEAKGACACQRLPNGNTFIACNTGQLLEVDRAGKVVREMIYHPQADLWTARRLPGGEVVAFTMAGQLAHLDAAGKEMSSVPVYNRHPYRTTYDILPNGHLLMPQTQDEKVAEYDLDGKVVWTAALKDQPSATLRLPGGPTLVWYAPFVLELDRAGRVTERRYDQSWNVLLRCR